MTGSAARPRVVPWPSEPAERAAIASTAADILAIDGLVVFPTDTVYGIGAHGARPGAVSRLFEVKRRPPTKQIALLIDDVKAMRELAAEVPRAAEQLAERFWPGPLTLVLRSRTDDETIAFRQPAHDVPRALIRAVGWPLATTSANLSGQPSPLTADDVLAQLTAGYQLLIDGGPCPGGADSTVLDLTGATVRVLRSGPLDRRELEALIGTLAEP